MAFEGIIENTINNFENLKNKFLESPLVQKIQERYENLNPSQQKLTLIGIAVLSTFFILYFPVVELLNSTDESLNFENKRNLTKALLKSYREVNHLPDIPLPFPSEQVKNIIDNQIKDMNLVPEQIKSVTINNGNSRMIPQSKVNYGIDVVLSKLNLKQITNLGSRLQSIHSSVKLKDMTLRANVQDDRYIDVTFKLIALNIPRYIPPPPEPEIDPKKNKKNSKKSSKGDDE